MSHLHGSALPEWVINFIIFRGKGVDFTIFQPTNSGIHAIPHSPTEFIEGARVVVEAGIEDGRIGMIDAIS